MQLTKETSAEMFIALANAGVEKLVEAGQLLVRLYADDEFVGDKIKATAPWITDGHLSLFIRLGQGTLLPQMLLNSCPAYRKLRWLPVAMQQHALKNRTLPLATGQKDVIEVAIVDMTIDQAAQVITPNGFRNKEEQLAWLRCRKAIKEGETIEMDTPYTVTKNKCIFRTPCTLTRKELVRVLAEME